MTQTSASNPDSNIHAMASSAQAWPTPCPKAFLASSPAQMRAAKRRLQNEGSKRSLVDRTVVEPNPHSSEVSPEAKGLDITDDDTQ